jgi:hypothetical protein
LWHHLEEKDFASGGRNPRAVSLLPPLLLSFLDVIAAPLYYLLSWHMFEKGSQKRARRKMLIAWALIAML